MEELRHEGLNRLRQYINSLETTDQKAFEKRLGTTINYLRNAITNKKRFDGELCVKIENASYGNVKRYWLRPGIWPELVSQDSDFKANVN